ncbi:type I-E CRISPR-associated protein Cas6/Cse3/CasE [Acinetobacter sp. P1(2025)]|uniref:type I-E CRISPR-associated protein Cas6/Cse3/CasE n=1 Tax=Acinetobacter sp. P1(2025) TaxID=3446120 RepID=UPI003F52ADE3
MAISRLILDGWYFTVKINRETDAHSSLVRWLRERNLGHLFSGQEKKICYFTTEYNGSIVVLARSSVEIQDPSVTYKQEVVDLDQPISFVIRLNATKLKRPPNLKYEQPTKSFQSGVLRSLVSDDELNSRVQDILDQAGLNLIEYAVIDSSNMRVFHKSTKSFMDYCYMDVHVKSKIRNSEQFKTAWQDGVGAKRVYGFGAVRLLTVSHG